MGQWPTLLTLPGFQNKPTSISRCDNFGSAEFADLNDREWNQLISARPVYHTNAKVVTIASTPARPHPYQLSLADGTTARAECVDICGGPGQALGLSTPAVVDSSLDSEFTAGKGLVWSWPRLLSGEMYLSQPTNRRTTPGSVCVVGGGPTAAWCVQRAQSLGDSVVWLAQETLNGAFVSSRRNDGLLQGPVTRKLVNGEYVVDSALLPSSMTTVFGEGVDVSSVAVDPSNQVEVNFVPVQPWAPQFTNHSGHISAPSIIVDQVIVAIGQATEDKHPQSWASMVKALLAKSPDHFIEGREKRVVGLQSKDKKLRVLGAAALSHPDLKKEWKDQRTPSNVFFRSLVDQARVPNGITLAALTIAEANNFWPGTVNDNLNTAGLKDLENLTSSWPSSLDGAKTWFETRGHRVPPFDLSEFSSLLNRKIHY